MAGQTFQALELELRQLRATGLQALLAELLDSTADQLEGRTRDLIEARLTMRSRALLTSVRSDVEVSDGRALLTLKVGGDYQGLRVLYAAIQEDGGVIEKSRGALAIPLPVAQNGPGIPRYPDVKRTPHMELVWPEGSAFGWLQHMRTQEPWYLLVRRVTIKPKHFARDAFNEVVGGFPDQLQAAFGAALGGG